MRRVLAGLALSQLILAPAALAQVPQANPPAPATPAAPPPAAAPAQAAPGAPATAPSPAPAAATPDQSAMTPPAAPAEPPPAAPTDALSISLLNALTKICVPAANGGDIGALAKPQGFRKSGDNWVYKQPGYSFTILPKGSTPNACQIEIVSPVETETPVKSLVLAIRYWAVFSNGWTQVRNDIQQNAQQLTTRTWEHNADGKFEALALTTTRKADGSPASRAGDTSTLIYSVTKS